MTEDTSSVFFTDFEQLKKSLEGKADDERPILTLAKKNISPQDENKQWFTEDFEGQLSVDVFQTKDTIIVESTIAGVKPDQLEIYLHNDLLTIRGKRDHEFEESDKDYFYRECYWGGFSRSIILPVEVQADKVAATLKNGVLKIVLPKAQKSRVINVEIKED
jgi:HSP20 family protein